MKNNAFLVLIFVGLSACATTSGGGSGAPYGELIAKAEAAYKNVDSAGGAWRDTKDLIDAAKKEADAKNMKKATELAQQAYDEATIASQQSESQKNAGPWLF